MVNLLRREYTEEEALSKILNYLRNPESRVTILDNCGNDLYIPSVITNCINELQQEQYDENLTPPQNREFLSPGQCNTQTNSDSFYDAAWNLCTRGILRPTVAYPPQPIGMAGAGFKLTSYGKEWLNQTNGYECIPSEYGPFSKLLARNTHRFGNGYHVRSQEAVNCYRAHAYLACCVMCGAASESILLALAIAKEGDEELVLKEYERRGGKTYIEKLLSSQQSNYVSKQLPDYTKLLTYWRNSAAHGADTNISEIEAFTSLLLLLRFAEFASKGWNELTTSNP